MERWWIVVIMIKNAVKPLFYLRYQLQ